MRLWKLSHGHEMTSQPLQWEAFKRGVAWDSIRDKAIKLAFDQNINMTIEEMAEITGLSSKSVVQILMSE